MFAQLPSLILLILGFGFVIFFHELGHFLAAKWVGIKVEQFAVGFGQALVSWRQGLGFRAGSSGKEYEELCAAGKADGIGETEYRLNWIPLGGYVKMLGQDDLRPNAEQDDPRAYNKKSIPARMFVVSAGVIMNIILAAVGFMIVFSLPGGFRVQPPVVGQIIPNSPAARTTRLDGTIAPLQVGDRIEMYDGKWQHDFTKITLNVALSGQGNVPIYVKRRDGTGERLNIEPARSETDANGFLQIGVYPVFELRSVDEKLDDEVLAHPEKYVTPDYLAVKAGEHITAVNGQPVGLNEYWKLDQAVQDSNGKPVTITVADASGKTLGDRQIHPEFATPFGSEAINFAGMVPRAVIQQLNPDSSAKDKLYPDDVVLSLAYKNGDRQENVSRQKLMEMLEKAGGTQQPVDFVVLRGEKEVPVPGLVPNVKLQGRKGAYGLSVMPWIDDQHAVVAETMANSPAAIAGIPAGATITAINGQPVKTWFDVKRLIAAAKVDEPIKLAASTPSGSKDYALKLDKSQQADVAGLTYVTALSWYPAPLLHDRVEPRKAPNAAVAAAWGVTETRDFILQFYLTIHRMVQGSVSYKNMMGPVGIFNAGRQFAYKGTDWLIWFLSMISANLAVVNFLPIPIVDGGLFTFLVVEKIQGRPLSMKTQQIAQFVGLAIILSVFLLVTYQDIARIAL
jgi:regulator of sigma E protease